MFCQSNSKSSQPGYLQHTTSSAQKSVRAQDNVKSRAEGKVTARESYHNMPPSPSLKNVQPPNWNALTYNTQNYPTPSLHLNPTNFQDFRLKFSNNIDKENISPPREKNPSPPPSRSYQNKHSSYPYEKSPEPSLPYFAKENYPSYPINSSPSKKSLPTQSTQSDSTYLPPLSKKPLQLITASQKDQDKKPLYSPKISRSQQDPVLKQVDLNIAEKPRGRGWTRNQDMVGNPFQDPISPFQNHVYGLYNNHQASGRGTSSDNQTNWQRSNLTRKEKIVGIRNFNNTCFAGSLLQCLYHLPTFKECLYKCIKDHPSNLISLFEELFRSMDRVSVEDVNSSAFKLISQIFRIRPHEFKPGVQGSSEIFFRAITEELGLKSPLVQLFWRGRYSKTAECQKCFYQMKMIEDIFILHAKDIDYKPEKAEDGSLFQTGKGLRSCRKCQVQTSHSTSYEFESLPNVLAIAISDTVDTKSSNKLIPNISVQTKDGKTVQYEYFAGVVNMRKGSVGVHSIAVVKSNENEGGGYFELNDSIARSLPSLDSVSLYPKLIFYQRINFPSPKKPDSPHPSSSSNRVNYHLRDQPIRAFPLQDEKKELELVKEPSEFEGRGRKMESSGNTQRQTRCASHAPFTQKENPSRLEYGRRIALVNQQGTSYAGALLQCLYHLPNLKKLLYDHEKKYGEMKKKIVSLLAHFFKSMDQMSVEDVNESAEKFIEFVTETYRFKHGMSKDSRDFWNIIYEEVFSSNSGVFTLSPNMFTGTSEVIATCSLYNQTKKLPRNTALLALNERDYTNEMIGHGHFSTSLSQSLICRCYLPSSLHHRSEVMFAAFPDILVISFLPRTEKFFTESKLLQKILLKGSDQTVQIYEYQAGILTKFREGDGQHSIAVIQCGGSKDSYFTFGDNTVVKTNLHDTAYHPRLLFYRKYIPN